MNLQIYDREVAQPKTRVNAQRSLNTGTVTPQAQSSFANKLSGIGLEVAQKVKAADQSMEYSKIIADAKMKMGVFYSSRSKDAESYATLTDDTDEYFKQLSSELTEGVSDVTQKARIQQGMLSIGQAMHQKAISDSTAQSIDNTIATHKHTRALMVQEAAFGTDDEMRTVYQNYTEQTRYLAKLGIFSQEDAENDVLSFYNDAARGKVRRMMNDSPEDTLEYLLNPNTFARMITNPEHRENLIAQTQRLIDAKDRRAEVAYKELEAKKEKQLKEWQAANYIKSYNDIMDGTLDAVMLRDMAYSGLLTPTAYKDLSTMQRNRNKEFVGNPEMFQQMRERAWFGELELRDVIQGVNNEQINYDQAQALNNEIQAGATIVQTEGYQTHLNSLKTILGWTPMGMPSTNQSILIGKATVEFRQRLINGEDITDVFEDVSKRYSLSARSVYPKPRFATIQEAKKNLIAGPALDSEIQAIKYFNQRAAEEAEFNKNLKQDTGNE